MHADQALLGEWHKQVDIALHEGVLGDERKRMPGLQHHFDQLPGQLELALDGLVGIGVDAQGDRLRHIARPGQFLAQQLRRIDLGEQAGFEVQSRGQVQVRMGRAREAVGTPTLYVFGKNCSSGSGGLHFIA